MATAVIPNVAAHTPLAEVGDAAPDQEMFDEDSVLLNPLEGTREQLSPQSAALYPIKVSEDGSLVAVWCRLYKNHEGGERWVLVFRVDDGSEVRRFLLDTPGDGYSDEERSAVRSKREAKAEEWLSRYQWTKMPTFYASPLNIPCGQPDRTQKLAFSNLQMTLLDLHVRVTRPTGEVLLDRVLRGWNVYPEAEKLPMPKPESFWARFVALSFKRRVMVLAMECCERAGNYDLDMRYRVVRLPEL